MPDVGPEREKSNKDVTLGGDVRKDVMHPKNGKLKAGITVGGDILNYHEEKGLQNE